MSIGLLDRDDSKMMLPHETMQLWVPVYTYYINMQLWVAVYIYLNKL